MATVARMRPELSATQAGPGTALAAVPGPYVDTLPELPGFIKIEKAAPPGTPGWRSLKPPLDHNGPTATAKLVRHLFADTAPREPPKKRAPPPAFRPKTADAGVDSSSFTERHAWVLGGSLAFKGNAPTKPSKAQLALRAGDVDVLRKEWEKRTIEHDREVVRLREEGDGKSDRQAQTVRYSTPSRAFVRETATEQRAREAREAQAREEAEAAAAAAKAEARAQRVADARERLARRQARMARVAAQRHSEFVETSIRAGLTNALTPADLKDPLTRRAVALSNARRRVIAQLLAPFDCVVRPDEPPPRTPRAPPRRPHAGHVSPPPGTPSAHLGCAWAGDSAPSAPAVNVNAHAVNAHDHGSPRTRAPVDVLIDGEGADGEGAGAADEAEAREMRAARAQALAAAQSVARAQLAEAIESRRRRPTREGRYPLASDPRPWRSRPASGGSGEGERSTERAHSARVVADASVAAASARRPASALVLQQRRGVSSGAKPTARAQSARGAGGAGGVASSMQHAHAAFTQQLSPRLIPGTAALHPPKGTRPPPSPPPTVHGSPPRQSGRPTPAMPTPAT